MGVEHYLVCNQCKEYIDLHKAYMFDLVCTSVRPMSGDPSCDSRYNLCKLNGNYWESRGLWFLWKHKEHVGIEMMYDVNDDWYDKEPYLKEVFKHEDDCELRAPK